MEAYEADGQACAALTLSNRAAAMLTGNVPSSVSWESSMLGTSCHCYDYYRVILIIPGDLDVIGNLIIPS